MEPEIVGKITRKPGEKACHRKPPVLLPTTLGQFELLHQPCIREQCTLWDAEFNQCLDVTNAKTLADIARALGKLEDHLPPELP